MRFSEARFVGAFLDVSKCPSDRPGIVFSGRSNVGKSTLLNRIAARALARTSKTPGRTRQLIYYAMTAEKLPPFYLIDLPGYGYASGPKTERERFGRSVRALLASPDRVSAVLQLVDLNVPWQDSDLEMLDWLLMSDRPFALVFTKCDRTNRGGPSRHLAELRRLLPWRAEIPVLPTSGRDNEGVVGVRKFLADALQGRPAVASPGRSRRPPGRPSVDRMPDARASEGGSSTSE